MSDDHALAVEVCRTIGARVPLWTQGPGGNVSVKTENLLWIKASGLRLDSVNDASGLVALTTAELSLALRAIDPNAASAEQAYADMLAASVHGSHRGRPSMEAGFHSLLPATWVLHFHSLPAIIMAHEWQRDAAALTGWLESHTDLTFTLCAPARPGLLLSRQLGEAAPADVYLLSNHGVVLQDRSNPLDAGSTFSRWALLERAFCVDWGADALFGEAPAAAPLRCYFPDTAVFLDRVQRILVSEARDSTGVLQRAAADAAERDRNAFELWQATALLYGARPGLEELPLYISETVGDIPTEKIRRL